MPSRFAGVLAATATLFVSIACPAFAAPEPRPPQVRLILFTPSDLAPPEGYRQRLTQIAAATDAFLFRWMDRWGYPAAVKSLFRREADGLVEVMTVRGEQPVASHKYDKPNVHTDFIAPAETRYRVSEKGTVWWIFVYLGDRPARFNDFGGYGNPRDGGWAMVNYDTLPGEFRPELGPAQGFNGRAFLKGSIHELGHAFGLPHAGPDFTLDLGNALMGPTNAIYASRNLPKPDQVYLDRASAAMLWKHPVFAGKPATGLMTPGVKLAEYRAAHDRAADAVEVSGTLSSNQRAHTAILIDDRGGTDEYWFPAYTGRIGAGGAFRIRIDKPARVSGRYRMVFAFENGLTTGDGARVMYSDQGYVRKPYQFVDGEFQFVTPPIVAGVKFAAPFRDDFDGGPGPGWQWIDPKGDSGRSYDARPGFLRIVAKGYHDLWPGSGNFTAPRLLREADGDFVLETKLSGPGRWCGGLLVWQDRDNFVRLDRGLFLKNIISFAASNDGEYTAVGREYVDADPVWLRLERAGSRYTASYSVDGKVWLPLKRFYTGPKTSAPKAPDDSMSLLKETELLFRDGTTSLEMRAAGPLLVGLSGLVPNVALPEGITQSTTDYDYFTIRPSAR